MIRFDPLKVIFIKEFQEGLLVFYFITAETGEFFKGCVNHGNCHILFNNDIRIAGGFKDGAIPIF